MSHHTLSRLIAAIFMAVIIAAAINVNHIRYHQMGREAYLDYQGQKYDRYMAEPDLAAPVIESVLISAAFVVLYELIAYNSLKIITTLSRRQELAEK